MNSQVARRQRLLEQQTRAEQRVRHLATDWPPSCSLAQSDERRLQLERDAVQARRRRSPSHKRSCAEWTGAGEGCRIQQLQGAWHSSARSMAAQAAVQELERLQPTSARNSTPIVAAWRLAQRHDVLARMEREMVGYYDGVRSVWRPSQGAVWRVCWAACRIGRVPAASKLHRNRTGWAFAGRCRCTGDAEAALTPEGHSQWTRDLSAVGHHSSAADTQGSTSTRCWHRVGTVECDPR